MAKELSRKHHSLFEGINHTDANGNEFWSARELSKVLEYSEYRHFLPVIERAKEACVNSGQQVADHFEDILEMITLGNGAVEPMDYAIFQNHGYMGLYGGLDAKAIHKKKGLKQSQQILDHMGSTELAANLFRATQTEEKLRRENIKGKQKANQTHFDVGKKVRKTIEELGGEMPENLPVADSIKKIEKAGEAKQLKAKKK